ncbi:MAG: ribonuclease HII [Firmicutes bacterium]|nr:ribonuclease HII [Bacillota bacterium]
MSLEDILEYKKSLNSSKEKKMITKLDLLLGSNDNYRYERKLNSEGYKLIGGVDEVGRGPLVGPVVAACVILPVGYKLEGLTDSKKLSEKKREEFYDIIMRDAIAVGVGEISAKVIDEVNIYEASKLAMLEAIKSLKVKPDYLLIDAMKLDIDIKQTSIIKGDFLSQSIAAASVIAKVTRDRMMVELDKKYPEYEFAKHKGYPTKRHVELIEKYGVLENYRFTYRPVCDLILKEKE